MLSKKNYLNKINKIFPIIIIMLNIFKKNINFFSLKNLHT